MRVEVREGPPSMFNASATFYVVACYGDDKEKLLGGPMTERNAMGMIDHIRSEGVPGEVTVDLPPPPVTMEPELDEKRISDVVVPLAYIAAAVVIAAFIYLM